MSTETNFKRRKGFIVNQTAVSGGALTYKEIIVLYKLIDQAVFIYDDDPKSLLDNEWFFFMGLQATKYLGMSEQGWCNTVTSLVNKGLVDKRISQPKGQFRPKNYYRINFEAVNRLESGCHPLTDEKLTQSDGINLNGLCSLKYTESMLKPTEDKPTDTNQVKRIVASQPSEINTSSMQEQPPSSTSLTVEEPKPRPYLNVLWKVWRNSAMECGDYTKAETSLNRGQFNRLMSGLAKAYSVPVVERMIKLWFTSDRYAEERKRAQSSFMSWFSTASQRLLRDAQGKGLNSGSRADADQNNNLQNIKAKTKI